MMSTYQTWLWEKRARHCIKNLERHDFDAHWVATTTEAHSFLLKMVAPYQSFGFGGSDTTRALGLVESLKAVGKKIYDHWQPDLSADQDLEIRKQQGQCDCFLCSANAIAATGEIVNVDGIGNRTNAMAFGPRKIIIVAGMNKIVNDLAAALERVKTTAAPMRAKSLGMATPCAETGICNDCNVPQRICRVSTILHRKPLLSDITVLLINEALGF
jgi:L-lactate utilization protein LutB